MLFCSIQCFDYGGKQRAPYQQGIEEKVAAAKPKELYLGSERLFMTSGLIWGSIPSPPLLSKVSSYSKYLSVEHVVGGYTQRPQKKTNYSSDVHEPPGLFGAGKLLWPPTTEESGGVRDRKFWAAFKAASP